MDSWEETFAELRKEFVLGAVERLKQIEESISNLQFNPQDDSALKELRRHFHGLSGAGGTYGFPQVSSLGLQGEQECDLLLQKQLPPTEKDLSSWSSILNQLQTEFNKRDEVEAEDFEKAETGSFNILIVNKDEDTINILSRFISQEGMSIRSALSKAEAISIIDDLIPDGIITDISLPDGTGYEVIEHLRSLPHGDMAAAIIISELSNLIDKVEAIRCGADGYFEKPLNLEALTRRLKHLLERDQHEPARILSVEDDPAQASFLMKVLESAGYKVRICSDPKRFDADFASFKPDLILMDILLPGISGYELARYLRQNESNASLPIIFLTTQGQMQVKIETLRAGGDDHLVKPVIPGLLLSAVATRIERAHLLKSLLDRDGLTGLLTHTAFLERAKSIFSQKERHKERSSVLIMIDIDHFKAVNDRYGHIMGDRVLASLSAVLRRRLRQSTSIGRYGGEEFVILIEDIRSDDAVRLVSRLLEEFSALPQHALNGEQFYVTFSAGIAVLEQSMDLENWKKAADDALYKAKKAGRNCIKLAS